MKATYEHISTEGRSLKAFIREDDRFAFNWHYHSACELTLILESHGQRIVGNSVEDYGPGDLILLGPNLPHTWHSFPPTTTRTNPALSIGNRAVVVHFEVDFVGNRSSEIPEFGSISRLLDRSVLGLNFSETASAKRVVMTLESLPNESPVRQLLLLLEILEQLAEESEARLLSSAEYIPSFQSSYESRIDNICTYVAEHLEHLPSQTEMARRVGMNPSAFCRFFKQATGRTYVKYVNEVRISRACRLLIETDLSVTEIGYHVGFGNHANFNRQFRRLKGISPGRFRRQIEHCS